MTKKKTVDTKKTVIISKDCRYSHGAFVKDFKAGQVLTIDKTIVDGFSIASDNISQKFANILKFNNHII